MRIYEKRPVRTEAGALVPGDDRATSAVYPTSPAGLMNAPRSPSASRAQAHIRDTEGVISFSCANSRLSDLAQRPTCARAAGGALGALYAPPARPSAGGRRTTGAWAALSTPAQDSCRRVRPVHSASGRAARSRRAGISARIGNFKGACAHPDARCNWPVPRSSPPPRSRGSICGTDGGGAAFRIGASRGTRWA